MGGVRAIMTTRVTPLSDQTWYSAIFFGCATLSSSTWWGAWLRMMVRLSSTTIFFLLFSLLRGKVYDCPFFFCFFSFSPHSFIFLFDFYSFYKSLNFFNLVLQLQFLIFFVFHLSPYFLFYFFFLDPFVKVFLALNFILQSIFLLFYFFFQFDLLF